MHRSRSGGDGIEAGIKQDESEPRRAVVIDGAAGTPADLTVPLEDRTEWVFAPNLSYFGEREKFGGWSFDNDPNHLEAWLADPSLLKPMTPELNDLEDGRILGMPNFGLDDEQIEGLIALLESLR